MSKPFGASLAMANAVVISPEAPYPSIGGGALRTASLLEHLRRRYALDIITFREPGRPDPRPAFPPGMEVHVIDLPCHAKTTAARAARNLARACRGVPPLVDRFAGFESAVRAALAGRRFDLGVVEHFWCAPYAEVLRPLCRRLVLNMHNIESVLARRQAEASKGPVRLLFARFATCCERLEKTWLPAYDDLLVPSAADAAHVGRGIVYPNAVPEVPRPDVAKREEIVFSGNLEYEPNQTAVRWFYFNVWQILRERRPELRWRLVGRNEHCVRPFLRGDPRVELSGAVDDSVAEIARARAAVVPLLSGSGTRVKIIEAWAAAVPVISTTIGAEGLPAVPEKDLRIANTPDAFVRVIEDVLGSEEQQRQLGMQGRRLYEQCLTWTAAWESLKETGL
jgi:glycosyltransferase involved in cell wall biosynthesis